MSYVLLQPHSNTNPTANYRVANFTDVVRHLTDGTEAEFIYESADHAEALAERERRNAELFEQTQP